MSKYGAYLRRDFISHTRRVQNLYKRIVRNEECYYRDMSDIKFVWATVRAEFEKHRYVRDLRTAKMLMEEGERKLFLRQHPQPKKFIHSPGGILYERAYDYDDAHFDLYHPLEKAQYPYFFEKREQAKKDYVAYWEKTQSKSSKKSEGATESH